MWPDPFFLNLSWTSCPWINLRFSRIRKGEHFHPSIVLLHPLWCLFFFEQKSQISRFCCFNSSLSKRGRPIWPTSGCKLLAVFSANFSHPVLNAGKFRAAKKKKMCVGSLVCTAHLWSMLPSRGPCGWLFQKLECSCTAAREDGSAAYSGLEVMCILVMGSW